MPGGALIRAPSPGTGRRLLSSESPPPPPFRYSAREVTSLLVRESQLQLTCTGCSTVSGALSAEGNSALRASVYELALRRSSMRCASTARLRSPTSRRRVSGKTELAIACFVSSLRQHPIEMAAALTRLPPRSADRLRALARQSLRLRCSCLRVWPPLDCHAKHRRLSCAGLSEQACVTPSFQFPALRSASLLTSTERQSRTAPLQNSGRAQAPLRLRSGRRNIGDTRIRYSLRSPAPRIESERMDQTMRPRWMDSAAFGTWLS